MQVGSSGEGAVPSRGGSGWVGRGGGGGEQQGPAQSMGGAGELGCWGWQ